MAARTSFTPLPYPNTSKGAPRKTGVEVEFSGLDTDETSKIVQTALGGTREGDDPFCRDIVGTTIGDIKVELDTPATKASDNTLVRKGLDVAAAVVPLEIITQPLDLDELATFDAFLPKLRREGAEGSRSGALLGFGVHLNPEVVSTTDAHTMNTIRAYGLLENYVRQLEKLDLTRRMLPFVSPWPDAFTSDILDPGVETLEDLIPVTARHITSRNHGLDLLPLLKFAHPEVFEQCFADMNTKARPAYHFRLPDCRIDEPQWTLMQPWALWLLVETVAAHPEAMADLSAAWRDRQTDLLNRQSWADETAAVLHKHDLEPAA